MEIEINVSKVIRVSTTTAKIENYLRVKKWSLQGRCYRSPCSKFPIYLETLGCQLTINCLAAIEKRETYALWLEIEELSTRVY